MRVKFYCDLYISECWEKKKEKLINKLRQNALQPQVWVIILSQGKQNHLEFFSSALLKQHVFDNAEIFVVGIADGYDEALYLTEKITGTVYRKTEDADIRQFIVNRQLEYEKAV